MKKVDDIPAEVRQRVLQLLSEAPAEKRVETVAKQTGLSVADVYAVARANVDLESNYNQRKLDSNIGAELPQMLQFRGKASRLEEISATRMKGLEVASCCIGAGGGAKCGDVVVVQPREGGLTACVCDCVDHGAAASDGAQLLTGVLEQQDLAKSPAQVISEAHQGVLNNEELARQTVPDMASFTAEMAVANIDLDTRMLRCARAGMHEPLLVRPGDKATEIELPRAMPVGFGMEDMRGEDVELETQLRPGDILVMFSDGLYEQGDAESLALNRSLPLNQPEHPVMSFGVGRVSALVGTMRDQSADAIAEGLVAAARKYGGPRFPEDDLSVVVIKIE